MSDEEATKGTLGEKKPSGVPRYEVQPLMPDDKEPRPKKFSPFLRQVFTAAGPIMATVSSGMTAGFSAVVLPQLEAANSTIPITSEQGSWIASLAPLPMALGCVLSGVLLDRLGRRGLQIVICIPFVIGWALLAGAQDLAALLGGRFLTGLCVGLSGPPMTIYIGETAGPQYRGLLLAAISLAVSVGILTVHVLGAVLDWRITAAVCGTTPLASWALLIPVPESPVWLAAKGKLPQAARAFRWLRGYDEQATLELQALMARHGAAAPVSGGAASATLTAPLAIQAPPPPNPWAHLPVHKQLMRRAFIRPFMILNTFFFIMQWSGVNAVAFYTVSIMAEVVGGGIDEYVATICLDVIRVLLSAVACVLLRRLGRRPLAVGSTAAAGAALMALAAFMALGDPKQTPWVPVTLMAAYIAAVSLGLVPLPWVMSGEVFPAAMRGVGGGASSAMAFLFFFMVVKTGPALFASLKPAGAFALYGIVALVGTVFLYIFLPETKNRTLQEIEDELEGKGRKKKTGQGEEKCDASGAV